jgi:hypothetical protein
MKLFGKKTCGHESTHPFRCRCTRETGHAGRHGARGLRWASDGKILFASRKSGNR